MLASLDPSLNPMKPPQSFVDSIIAISDNKAPKYSNHQWFLFLFPNASLSRHSIFTTAPQKSINRERAVDVTFATVCQNFVRNHSSRCWSLYLNKKPTPTVSMKHTASVCPPSDTRSSSTKHNSRRVSYCGIFPSFPNQPTIEISFDSDFLGKDFPTQSKVNKQYGSSIISFFGVLFSLPLSFSLSLRSHKDCLEMSDSPSYGNDDDSTRYMSSTYIWIYIHLNLLVVDHCLHCSARPTGCGLINTDSQQKAPPLHLPISNNGFLSRRGAMEICDYIDEKSHQFLQLYLCHPFGLSTKA